MRINEITPMEEQAYLRLCQTKKEVLLPEAESIRTNRINTEAAKITERMHVSLDQAVEMMKSRVNGYLLPQDFINFQTFGNVPVAKVLESPKQYDNQACADPLEPEEGTSRAKFFANAETGTPLIRSMLHGGSIYYLQHEINVIPREYYGNIDSYTKASRESISGVATLPPQKELTQGDSFDASGSDNLRTQEADIALIDPTSTTRSKWRTLKSQSKGYVQGNDACDCYPRLEEIANGRVILEYVPYALNEATEKAERAMLKVPGKWLYFSYGNVLSYSTYEHLGKKPLRADEVNKQPSVPVIKPYNQDSLFLRMEQSMLHYKVEKNNGIKTNIPIPTPSPVINKLLEHPSPLAPKVSGLVSHPVLAMDGRVIDKEGIDDAIGLLLQFGGNSFHPVPDHVSQDDARAAADRIFRTLFSEFCFKAGSTENGLYATTALAMLLTGVFRKVIDQAPGFLVVANVQGSGKTSLARLVHVILTGKDMPVSSLGGSSEEMKKEMLAIFLQSPAMVCFDNILDGSELNDPMLAKIITSPEFKGRILGKTQEATVPTNTLITITGNNVTLGADLVRRFVTVSLTSNIAQPEQRVYQHADISQHCLNSRQDVIRDCIMITKAYLDAGCPINPADIKNSGFVQWDMMVRLPLLWACNIDVLGSINENRKQSNEHLAMIRLLHNLCELFPNQPFTASKVMAIVQDPIGVEEALANSLVEGLASLSSKSLTNIKSLAWVLKKLEGRILDGLTLEKRHMRNRADEYLIKKEKEDKKIQLTEETDNYE